MDGDYRIEDLGNANGTEVEGRAIKGMGKVRVDPGEVIRISETEIEIERLTPCNLNPSWTYEDGAHWLTRYYRDFRNNRFIEPFFEPGQAIDPSRV